jgi:hypothetical protein
LNTFSGADPAVDPVAAAADAATDLTAGGAQGTAGAAAPEALPATEDAVPGGLPPEEIKRQVLDLVYARLAGHKINKIEDVHAELATIAAANRDRGLTNLRVTVADTNSLEVAISASASPPEMRRIAWTDIFSASELDANEELEEMREALGKASMSSHAAVSVGGKAIGRMSSSSDAAHAEEGLVRGPSWQEAIAAAKQELASSGSARVTLMINRSPCIHCVSWLTEAIATAKAAIGDTTGQVTFLLAATGTYRRQARLTEEDRKILAEGSKRIADRTGRPYDDVLEEQTRIWKADMRSESTEFVDEETGEVESGLGNLAAAGWQLAGLDAGQPMTLRQVEFAEIAARLSRELAWSS